MLRVDDVMALSTGLAPAAGREASAGLPSFWKIRHLDSPEDWDALCNAPAMRLVAELETVAVRPASPLPRPAPETSRESQALRELWQPQEPERTTLCWIDLYYEQHLSACAARELFESGALSNP